MRHRLLAVTLLLLWASNLCFADYELVGTLYPLRWGQQEGSADMVTPANVLGQPLCVRMGSPFGCKLRLQGGSSNVLGWKVSSARLVSRISGQVYWTVTDPGVSNLISPSATYWLPNIPSWVDYARLEMSFVIYYWGAWGPVYYLTPPYSSEEVFIVLDEPKVPMSPAWVSVLRYSCVWARYLRSEVTVADTLTSRLWENGIFVYSPTFAGYTTNHSDYGEVFHLKAFMDQPSLRGQCNDLSDFLCVLMASVGLSARSQRTYSISEFYTGDGDDDGRGWQILTHVIDPAGSEVSVGRKLFVYHQFVTIYNGVWEPSFGFGNSNPPNLSLGWARDSEYKQALVDLFYHYESFDLIEVLRTDAPGNPWAPMPMVGFTPDVSTNNVP